MESVKVNKKEKLLGMAKTCQRASKVLYILACVVCVVFVVLAIVLPLTVKDAAIPAMELCAIMIDGALVAFFAIGILWNLQQWCKSIVDAQSPFTADLPKYLRKTGIITILASTVPAIVATAVVQSAIRDVELVFNVGIGGIICGIILIVMSVFFCYAADLQKSSDETL